MNYRRAWLALAFGVMACGGDDAAGLDKFLPEIPAPTGEAQSVWAGEITADHSDELIDGPATSGLVGDFFMRNSKARFVIQSPARVIGVVPQGGNLVDAVALDGDGNDISGDHFGELSMVYLVGRTCRHDSVEVVQDGSGGGAAVIRARGMAETNDFINLRGIGLLSIPLELDPDIDDGVECATTYVLPPDSTSLQVYWTLYNPGTNDINGPFGALNDTGGNTEAWAPTRGFERLGIDAITELGDPAPIDYTMYQGPGVAYGIVPRHEDPTITNSAFLIAGVSVVLFGADKLLDMLNEDYFYLHLPAQGGVTNQLDVVVGADAADTEEAFRTVRGEPVAELSGSVEWGSGGPGVGARVGAYEDSDQSGDIGPDDLILSYFDVQGDGSFSGKIPPGNYLLRAEVKDTARSAEQTVTLSASGTSGLSFTLPDPVYYDYSIKDDADDNFIPGRLTIVGHHPAYPDLRVFETYDRKSGVVKKVMSLRGTTVVGDDADPQFALAPGESYRIYASRGTEWSVDSLVVSPQVGDPVQNVDFRLRRVAPADGYVSSEYHVHMVGSPDSPVLDEERIKTGVAEGVELFAATDHDYVTELEPIIEAMGLENVIRSFPGEEITSFVYGHFQAYPVIPDPDSPVHGAVDWAHGTDGYAMTPGEIYQAARDNGAECVQINHPRALPGDVTDFQQFFDRAGVIYDYDNRAILSDKDHQPVPNDWMRLPEGSLWDDSFNTLEVWNGFATGDTNNDGVREIAKVDMVIRDWFNFLSFGFPVSPTANSDTHTIVKDPIGMPRTYVKVVDDSAAGIESGNIVDDALDTLTGGNPRDMVLTDGPFLSVRVAGETGSPLGSVVEATDGSITFDVEATSAEWAEINTIEVFSNMTPDVGSWIDESALQPLYCFTSRTGLADNDTCALATGGAQALTVDLEDMGNGINRYHATVSVTVNADDIVNREGATDGDAWLVFRVYGTRAIFPLMVDGVLDDTTVDTFVTGNPDDVNAILDGYGIPAEAFTSAVFVDFDGGGYTAIFSPE